MISIIFPCFHRFSPRNLAAGAGAIATGLGLAQGVAAQEGLGLADQESELAWACDRGVILKIDRYNVYVMCVCIIFRYV